MLKGKEAQKAMLDFIVGLARDKLDVLWKRFYCYHVLFIFP